MSCVCVALQLARSVRVYWHPGAFYSWLEHRLTADDALDEICGTGGLEHLKEQAVMHAIGDWVTSRNVTALISDDL